MLREEERASRLSKDVAEARSHSFGNRKSLHKLVNRQGIEGGPVELNEKMTHILSFIQ
jgi:hypothetical protein